MMNVYKTDILEAGQSLHQILEEYDDIPPALLSKYLDTLVDQFFKILPIKESGEPSLNGFMESLQRELIGGKHVIAALDNNPMYLSLIFKLGYMINNECDVKTVKQEVFSAISICKKLKRIYCYEEKGVPSDGRLGDVREKTWHKPRDYRRPEA